MSAAVDGVVTEDELWACTTCGACEEACPVYVEPISKIVAMRRNLVLEQGKISGTRHGQPAIGPGQGAPLEGRLGLADGLDFRPAT